ncbi:DUF4437 domain-containing protein [Phaeobacter sp. J2-8]|uniref:DUF4437 domain-containing protein n=1 Tax=Phaeobacter sp. J2-8 TaxID=2931394 RepID=UPI001FD57248|nr:DUF4437 domain-containing protein [Phaeobacter sp. J2-8]MCJ7870953.1 DUF4437 domain-containing protein [Phaeobacter sp. J2-8]
MKLHNLTTLGLTLALTAAGATQTLAEAHSGNELVKDTDVKFIELNPARGDASPRSGALWGDIREDVPSGMLVTFAEGFQSPPHIHNITYRAVVISGEVHNDDPAAAKMWMGPGSFWTQPLGENHITAAKTAAGERSMIFLEILSGPYLVQPKDKEFDGGELPINIDARNVMWLNAEDAQWIEGAGGAQMAYLWGSLEGTEKNGTFVKLPAGYAGTISTEAPLMRAVTIAGTTSVTMSGETETNSLNPGSYFGSKGTASHAVSCTSDADCILYMHTEGRYTLAAM